MVHRLRFSDRHRSSQKRPLRIESLEGRQLLASDTAAFAITPVLGTTAISESGDYSTADAAGSTRATAANLGTIDGQVTRLGSLGRYDRLDIVRFDVSENSKVSFTLDELNRDADLYLINRSGKMLASSKGSGTVVESIKGKLRSGTYYLAISAKSAYATSYQISLEAHPLNQPSTSTPSQPTSSEPTSESSTPSSPSPSYPTTPQRLSEVDYFGSTRDWNLNAIGAPEAWSAGYTGQGVTVAVIDTGIDLDHPDLINSLFVNPGEIPGNGIDDDQNGYVDDVSGYDFVDLDSYADDGNGHGTHVAGTIAASNNDVGATGVAPDAKVIPIRVLDDSGRGSDSSVAAGIRYAADIGAQIINLSLGGNASARIAAAVEYATSLGSLVIAAAGNDSSSVPGYPAQYSAAIDSVLSVGAFDSNAELASFSNTVGNSGAIQIDAPGVGIYSTYIDGRYGTLSGTSMATPHVSAVAALTLSANPNLTSSQLRSLLVDGVIGTAAGSDSLGTLSTLQTVAIAAAGVQVQTTSGTQSLIPDTASGTTGQSTKHSLTGTPPKALPGNTLAANALPLIRLSHETFVDQHGTTSRLRSQELASEMNTNINRQLNARLITGSSATSPTRHADNIDRLMAHSQESLGTVSIDGELQFAIDRLSELRLS
ncbi:S8 family serine peptidase [Stieleria sp. JC731]|uniref:S8 family serine peptidase n=1 Tax=Pirellulaceae TaxID=2691357 RepID=UPI001E4EBF63|nr:S8 family serine peptidase [Stieleria sp. JC731]MCC9602199.1 S8 family serine peptidase [Stieleria sp. JC731]